jgi:ketosteroid isomerase-like protein
MTKRLNYLLAGVVAGVVGCTQAGVDLDAERAALMAAADAYHAAGAASDTDAVAAMYTNDAVTMPPNADAVSGIAGMRQFAEAFTSLPNFSMSFGETVASVGAGGDMGYTLVDTIIRFDDPSGNPIEDRVRDLHLWKKEDGEWKVAVDIWNSELPLPSAASTPLEGAWVVTSRTDPEGNTNDEPAPALYVFTGNHYSVMFARGERPRNAGEEMTDEERIAAYESFTANSGRYEIDGNALKTRAFVAKSPNYMGDWPDNEQTFEFETDGETLTLTSLGFGAGTVTTFRQVEGSSDPWESE